MIPAQRNMQFSREQIFVFKDARDALDVKMMIIEILAPFLGSLLLPLNNKGQYVGESRLALTVLSAVPQVTTVISSCNLAETLFSKPECHECSAATLMQPHTGTIFLLAPRDLCNVINHPTVIVHS